MVMLKGVFRKIIAILGIMSTALGIMTGFVLFAPEGFEKLGAETINTI